jgi:hypothetical protein
MEKGGVKLLFETSVSKRAPFLNRETNSSRFLCRNVPFVRTCVSVYDVVT